MRKEKKKLSSVCYYFVTFNIQICSQTFKILDVEVLARVWRNSVARELWEVNNLALQSQDARWDSLDPPGRQNPVLLSLPFICTLCSFPCAHLLYSALRCQKTQVDWKLPSYIDTMWHVSGKTTSFCLLRKEQGTSEQYHFLKEKKRKHKIYLVIKCFL